MVTVAGLFVMGNPSPAVILEITGALQAALCVCALRTRQSPIKHNLGQMRGKAAAATQQLHCPTSVPWRNSIFLKERAL